MQRYLKIASYFYETGIAFSTVASSSLALMIEENMKFPSSRILFKVTRYLIYSNWELLGNAYESTDKCRQLYAMPTS